jgi:hypothetical protein
MSAICGTRPNASTIIWVVSYDNDCCSDQESCWRVTTRRWGLGNDASEERFSTINVVKQICKLDNGPRLQWRTSGRFQDRGRGNSHEILAIAIRKSQQAGTSRSYKQPFNVVGVHVTLQYQTDNIRTIQKRVRMDGTKDRGSY